MGRCRKSLSVNPKKTVLPCVAPYETAFAPIPKAVAIKFIKEIKRQGRESFLSFGCYPVREGDECMLVMSDWIGDSDLLHHDLDLISGFHSAWIREMVVGPKKKRRSSRK